MTKALPTRADFRFFLEIPTRWMDNDIYGHVNPLERWRDMKMPDGIGARAARGCL